MDSLDEQSLTERLRIRASIRREISTRKSVQEGKPDRIADLLEEAAREIEGLNNALWKACGDDEETVNACKESVFD